MNRKYLKLVEYSTLIKHKIPVKENYHHDLQQNDTLYRSSIIEQDTNIFDQRDSNDILDGIVNEIKFSEKIIPLDKIIIYDNLDTTENEKQEVLYVQECPICLYSSISINSSNNFCPYCENTKFPLTVIGLINQEQVKELIANEDNITVKIKDDKLICKNISPNSDREKEDIWS